MLYVSIVASLIKDAIEFLWLIYVEPMAGTGDHLVGQVRHEPIL